MKKLLLTFICVAFIPVFLMANPPKKVVLSYTAGKLKVQAIHPVKDVKIHYINLIIIKVDGKLVTEIKPKQQSSAQEELVEVAVPEIKPGSVVEVKSHCNLYGAKSETLKVK